MCTMLSISYWLIDWLIDVGLVLLCNFVLKNCTFFMYVIFNLLCKQTAVTGVRFHITVSHMKNVNSCFTAPTTKHEVIKTFMVKSIFNFYPLKKGFYFHVKCNFQISLWNEPHLVSGKKWCMSQMQRNG